MLKALLKLIPPDELYKDTAQPALRQIGQSLEKVVKASRFLLAPLEYLAAQHNRWERYLERISKNVPEENMVQGAPQIIIPALEGLCYAQEGTLLSEFFLNLLSKAIDKTKLDLAHPAFSKIIQQLSTDEAIILYLLKKKPYRLREKADFDHEKHLFSNRHIIEDEFPLTKIVYADHMWLYMDHLHSLNLAGTWQIGNQESIMDEKNGIQIGVFINSERKLTPFGELFAQACIPNSFPGL